MNFKIQLIIFFQDLLNIFICISKISYIVIVEYFRYLHYCDYSFFIIRLSQHLALYNILYVKVFQALAMNYHLVDEEVNISLLEYTNNAPWEFTDIDFESLMAISNEFQITFPNGFEKPDYSGMVSLVYKCYKENEENPIIVKIKRRNIDEKINNGIQNLLFLIRILSYFTDINKYKIVELINKNIEIIKEQTNFEEETNNMLEMKMNCKDLKYIYIPRVWKEVTERYPNGIVMEFIDGKTISKIDEKDYYIFAKLVVKFGVVTSLMHGFVHGDLHAGNILFIKDENETNEKLKYKLGILDLGIVFRVSNKLQSICYGCWNDLTDSKDTRQTAETLINSDLFIVPLSKIKLLNKLQYESIVELVIEIINDALFIKDGMKQFQIYKFIEKFHSYLKEFLPKYNLSFSDEFVKSQLFVAMAHGITMKLCKDDFKYLIDETMNELFHTNLFFSYMLDK